MWIRSELKARGKFIFKQNYWRCVLVALLYSIAIGAGASSVGSNTQQLVSNGGSDDQSQAIFFLAVTLVMLVISVISLAIKVFVWNPVIVGCNNFFVINSNVRQNSLGALGRGFNGAYGNVVKVSFATDIYTVLWSLLFIVPGILKAYSWLLVPYLLAENPGMNGKEARELSARLMYGHRWDTFVLQLSFIWWYLLGVCTLGILNVLYVDPYVRATMAEWYKVVRWQPQNRQPESI